MTKSNVVTYDIYTDSDTGVFRGSHWSVVTFQGQAVVPRDADGSLQPAATNFWWKCSAWRDAKNRAQKVADENPGAVIRRATKS